MVTQRDIDAYERGTELADEGKYEAALSCMCEHLRTMPHDAQALNDAGTILHCLNRSNEAIEYLERAYDFRKDSAEIVWNLVEAYLGVGMASKAASLFDEMEQMRILNIDVVNRTASMLLDQNKKGQAVEVLLQSLRLWPEQEVLPPILEIIRGRRPKVAFLCSRIGGAMTLADALAFFKQRFQTTYHERHSVEGICELLEQSDIAWLDGGGETVVEASKLPHVGKTIVSLRPSDIRGDWVREVRWEQLDILVQMGSSAVESALLEWVPDIRSRIRVVVLPDGIKLDRFISEERMRGKNLAFIGCLSLEANPMFLLQCMQKLHYIDPEYRLFFSGRFDSSILEQYVRHMVQILSLEDVVSFEPYPSDLNAWLSDKHFVVSSALSENQVESVLKGMAAGLKPVIHNFVGAETLFPPACLFNIAEEFCERVLGPDYDPEGYRRFVADRYPIDGHLHRANLILTQLEKEIDFQPLTTFAGGVRTDPLGEPSFPRDVNVADPVNLANL